MLPPIKSEKTSSLGYGNKYDFSKMANKFPGPNAYEIAREFDSNSIEKKGISIGIGRDVSKKIVETFKLNFWKHLCNNNKNNNPGPGAYLIKGSLNCRDISFGVKGVDAC